MWKENLAFGGPGSDLANNHDNKKNTERCPSLSPAAQHVRGLLLGIFVNELVLRPQQPKEVGDMITSAFKKKNCGKTQVT